MGIDDTTYQNDSSNNEGDVVNGDIDLHVMVFFFWSREQHFFGSNNYGQPQRGWFPNPKMG